MPAPRSEPELFAFIRRLIDIPSVTGGEGELGFFLERELAHRDFPVTLQEVGRSRYNVYSAPQGLARVILCTHIDTVPPFFGSSEDEAFIYGRGACDAKGVLAAMLAAAERLREEGVSGVGLLFVVGEEVDSAGAKAANRLAAGSSYVVVGEPTQSRLASGHKGTFKFRLRAEGRAAHSAYPHLGDSAIEHLLDMLERIRGAVWGRSDVLGEATVNIGTLAGGVAANVIAAEAEAQVFVRVVGKAEEVRERLEELLATDPSLSYERIAWNDAVFCETLPGFEVAPVAFGTDIPALSAFGKPLLFGPGSIHDAHTSSEKIPKSEAAAAVEQYYRIVTALLESSER